MLLLYRYPILLRKAWKNKERKPNEYVPPPSNNLLVRVMTDLRRETKRATCRYGQRRRLNILRVAILVYINLSKKFSWHKVIKTNLTSLLGLSLSLTPPRFSVRGNSPSPSGQRKWSVPYR